MSQDDSLFDAADKPSTYAFHANFAALKWEYVKSISILLLVMGAWVTTSQGTVGWYVTGILSGLFLIYLGHTVWRHGLRIEMDADGVVLGWRNPTDPDGGIVARRRQMPWSGLKNVKLRYFSRNQKSEQTGWMMVQLEGLDPDGEAITLTFDGDHEGFQPVLREALVRARRKGLPLDEPTLANLEATGIETHGDTASEPGSDSGSEESQPWTP